jgi:chaperone required for assembly of F1-ATPase
MHPFSLLRFDAINNQFLYYIPCFLVCVSLRLSFRSRLIWRVGFERAVTSTKSFCIALALMERQLSVQGAARAARVEALAQIQRWGSVEDTHDVEVEDMHRQLASALCYRY